MPLHVATHSRTLITASAVMRHAIFVGGSGQELTATSADSRHLLRNGHSIRLWNEAFTSNMRVLLRMAIVRADSHMSDA